MLRDLDLHMSTKRAIELLTFCDLSCSEEVDLFNLWQRRPRRPVPGPRRASDGQARLRRQLEGGGRLIPILNYTTKVAAHVTVGLLQVLLASKGATDVLVTYSEGLPDSLTLATDVADPSVPFRLPSL